MPPPSLSDLLSVATDAAYLAGRRQLIFNTGVAVEIKADDTETNSRRPRERGHHPRSDRRQALSTDSVRKYGRWRPRIPLIIDPIDGTKSFIRGVPLYGVMIGVEVSAGLRRRGLHAALDEMLTVPRQGSAAIERNGRPEFLPGLFTLRGGGDGDQHRQHDGTLGRLCAPGCREPALAHVGRLLRLRPGGDRPRRGDAGRDDQRLTARRAARSWRRRAGISPRGPVSRTIWEKTVSALEPARATRTIMRDRPSRCAQCRSRAPRPTSARHCVAPN